MIQGEVGTVFALVHLCTAGLFIAMGVPFWLRLVRPHPLLATSCEMLNDETIFYESHAWFGRWVVVLGAGSLLLFRVPSLLPDLSILVYGLCSFMWWTFGGLSTVIGMQAVVRRLSAERAVR